MASTSMLVDVKGAGEAAKGMAAGSRGVVRMMTRTITTHPKVNWKDLESGKLWGKKKDWSLASSGKKNLHIYTHI